MIASLPARSRLKSVLNFALKPFPPTLLPDNLPGTPSFWKEIRVRLGGEKTFSPLVKK